MNLLTFILVPTTKRLTFDILDQHPSVTFQGEDDGPYFTFKASNGYEVISRSRMDIQTERLWLKGGTNDDIALRSGSMVFSSNAKRDLAYHNFLQALSEWAAHHGGFVQDMTPDYLRIPAGLKNEPTQAGL